MCHKEVRTIVIVDTIVESQSNPAMPGSIPGLQYAIWGKGPLLIDVTKSSRPSLASQPYFSRIAHARAEGGGGREREKLRLGRLAGFSCTLPECG